jgi:predicted dehydrogenase
MRSPVERKEPTLPALRALSRRQLLRRGLAALAAGPLVIPASVRGQGGTAPSDRIVLGFIGTGGQGNQHVAGGPWTTRAGFLGRDDTHIVAVCDVERARRESTRRRVEDGYAAKLGQGVYKGCDAYADFRDLLARPDIDAVLIASPDHWHALHSIHAIRAGKDVYCEKPISLTIREARAMADAARRHARILQAGTQQRSSAAFRYACELVRNGRIGRVLRAHVNVGGTSSYYAVPAQPVPEGLDWDMWLGPAPWRPYNAGIHRGWMGHRDFSGGEMTNWGAHHFDTAQWGLGMDDTGPAEIHPPGGEFPLLTYRYASGVLLHHGGHPLSGVTFIGTEGMVNTDRWYCRTEPEGIGRQPIGPNDLHLYASDNHHDNFLRCVRTREKPVADIALNARSISLCHLGNIAYWLRRPLRWDPAKEEFLGDPDASHWLDRPQREPWSL